MINKESITLQIVKEEIEEKVPCLILAHRNPGYLESTTKKPRLREYLMEHWHRELEINYIFEETIVEYYIDGQKIRAQSGDLVIINCESIHSISIKKLPEDKQKISTITLIIDYDFLHEVIPDVKECVFETKEAEYLEPVKKKILELAKYYESETSEYKYVMVKGILYEILFFLCNEHIKKKKLALPHSIKRNVGRLRDILNYIDNYYQEPIQQGEVSKLFFLSRSYFARFFKSYTGITFQEYLTRFRLVKAEDKLLYSDDSITDIALDTGFSDTRYFINSFRKYYSITPYQYRLSHKKK